MRCSARSRSWRVSLIVVSIAVVVAGCGGSSSSGQTESSCDQILDRWFDVQQQLLVDLDDAEEQGLSEDAVAGRAAGTASGLFENSRDATRLGCEAVLEAGSSELCARLADLEAPGAQSSSALADLQSGCSG
jgi:hypothetical protein